MNRHFGGVPSGRHSNRAKLVLLMSMVMLVLFSVLAFALLSAGGSAKNSGEAAQAAAPIADIKMVEVLVPVEEIATGTALEARMFRKESRPQVGISDRVVGSFEEITNQYARSLIVPGQPLHKDYITAVRPTNVLTANIPEGFRAVTIRVDARTSVEGFVRPGASVDVVWASRIRGQPGVTVIVENAKVLSAERQVDQAANSGAGGGNSNAQVPSTVTLLVGAKDAQKIQLASTTGTLSLSLRGDTDKGRSDGAGSITINDLLGNKPPQTEEPIEGSVVIGGERWVLVDGQLKPAARGAKKD